MSAPERLYTNKNGTAIITPPAIPLHETDIEWLPAARVAELEAWVARLREANAALRSGNDLLLRAVLDKDATP